MSIKTPVPLLTKRSSAVDWWFAWKFNSNTYPGADKRAAGSRGLFDSSSWSIDKVTYETDAKKFSQRYCVASSRNPTLQLAPAPSSGLKHSGGVFTGKGILGTSLTDPVGATFGQIYNAKTGSVPNFVVWNDQFYGNPIASRSSPAGHSKGCIMWDDSGAGTVVQVSTPSWPGSGTNLAPRQNDGNTLGFVSDDDVEVSQHFFALRLSPDDTEAVLTAMATASVVTRTTEAALANFNVNGGTPRILAIAKSLGKQNSHSQIFDEVLSSGVRVIAKPAALHAPPWQLVSAKLATSPDRDLSNKSASPSSSSSSSSSVVGKQARAPSLRVASWWANPKIESTPLGWQPNADCWLTGLGAPGAVQIANKGIWRGKPIGLHGTPSPDGNHAKVAVTTGSRDAPIAIFGDMNQQGTLGGEGSNPKSSQNGRGGMFFALRNTDLHASVASLITDPSDN